MGSVPQHDLVMYAYIESEFGLLAALRKLGPQDPQVIKAINNMWWNPRNSSQIAAGEAKARLLAKKAAKQAAADSPEPAPMLSPAGTSAGQPATPGREHRRMQKVGRLAYE